MKLADILARELRVWPNDDFASIGQACNGTLHKSPNWSVDCGWTKEVYTIAEDWSRSYVTRAQWQAAVDALNTGRAGSGGIKWNGEGLPPVGTVCEMNDGNALNEKWITGTVVCHVNLSERTVVVAHDGEAIFCSHAEDFRPIRTPEQIAADERDKAIEGMIADTNILTGIMSDRRIMAGQLYDAGYRKFEIVDN